MIGTRSRTQKLANRRAWTSQWRRAGRLKDGERYQEEAEGQLAVKSIVCCAQKWAASIFSAHSENSL